MASERVKETVGTLFVVATPLGNLDDLTFRAVKCLKGVDLIACEDTRRTAKLLNHLGIKKPLISCFEHNEHARIDELLARIGRGEDVALVSDAGTPTLSDPGFPLVRAALARGIRVSPISPKITTSTTPTVTETGRDMDQRMRSMAYFPAAAISSRARGIAASKRSMISWHIAWFSSTPGFHCRTRLSNDEKIAQTPCS